MKGNEKKTDITVPSSGVASFDETNAIGAVEQRNGRNRTRVQNSAAPTTAAGVNGAVGFSLTAVCGGVVAIGVTETASRSATNVATVATVDGRRVES